MEGAGECSICQFDFNAGEEKVWLSCCHSFHKECLERYMAVKNWANLEEVNCPNCRVTPVDVGQDTEAAAEVVSLADTEAATAEVLGEVSLADTQAAAAEVLGEVSLADTQAAAAEVLGEASLADTEVRPDAEWIEGAAQVEAKAKAAAAQPEPPLAKARARSRTPAKAAEPKPPSAKARNRSRTPAKAAQPKPPAKANAAQPKPPPPPAKAKAAQPKPPPPPAKAKAPEPKPPPAQAKAAELNTGSTINMNMETIFCDKCGKWKPYSNCRVVSKTANPTFRCGGCCVKLVQLTRGLGSWPPKSFAALPEATKQAFYSDMDGMNGFSACQMAKKFVEAHQLREEFFAEGGEFLPLSVWAQRGFDAARIEKNTAPHNTQSHPVLGECYRVAIMETGLRGTDGTTTTECASKPSSSTRPASSASSSSSSSSSSSDKKKKKKGKKDTKFFIFVSFIFKRLRFF